MTRTTVQEVEVPTRIVRLPDVMARTGLSRSTIYVRVGKGSFPKSVHLGARAVGWIEAEVDEWIRQPDRGEPRRGRVTGAFRRRLRSRRCNVS